MKNSVLVKMGGKFTADEENLLHLAAEMQALRAEYHFLIVHGGGAEVTALSRHFGIEPLFRDGIRITTREEMKYVDKVLSGKINKRLVRLFQKAGFDAVGLTGSDGRIFTGLSLDPHEESPSHTGIIKRVNPRLLELLLAENYLPVIGSTSMDEAGMALNINADEVAFRLAASLQCRLAIFLSDIPGILKEGQVLRGITTAQIEEEIAAGVITGGMIPKVKSAMETLAAGVGQIVIGQYAGPCCLAGLIDGDCGTHIRP